jgi:hypothetical protein
MQPVAGILVRRCGTEPEAQGEQCPPQDRHCQKATTIGHHTEPSYGRSGESRSRSPGAPSARAR